MFSVFLRLFALFILSFTWIPSPSILPTSVCWISRLSRIKSLDLFFVQNVLFRTLPLFFKVVNSTVALIFLANNEFDEIFELHRRGV